MNVDAKAVELLGRNYAIQFVRHFDTQCSDDEAVDKYNCYQAFRRAGYSHNESLHHTDLIDDKGNRHG